MCEIPALNWNGSEAQSPEYRDRRALLSPEEMFRWQLFRRNVRGKLLELEPKISAWKFTGSPRDLSRLRHVWLESPCPVLVLSVIPVRASSWGSWYDGYAFLVLSQESVYLVEINGRVRPSELHLNDQVE